VWGVGVKGLGSLIVGYEEMGIGQMKWEVMMKALFRTLDLSIGGMEAGVI
jgi:hypothetical protein